MKKLIIAVFLIVLTAAFEQKAANRSTEQIQATTAITSMDSVTVKLQYLNKIQSDEK